MSVARVFQELKTEEAWVLPALVLLVVVRELGEMDECVDEADDEGPMVDDGFG